MKHDLDPEGITTQDVVHPEDIAAQAARHNVWLRMTPGVNPHIDTYEFRGPLTKLVAFLEDVYGMDRDEAGDMIDIVNDPDDDPGIDPSLRDDLTTSGNVGVRWQAQMEQHLDDVRKLTNEALLHGIASEHVTARCHLANAHATAALALAVANGLGDTELALSKLVDAS